MSFYALLLNLVNHSPSLRRIRKQYISRSNGQCLEIGAGTGVNFSLYPQDVSVVALEPDLSLLQNQKVNHSAQIRFVQGSAEAMPFPAGQFDTVVASLVFCSIPDFNIAFSEAHVNARLEMPGKGMSFESKLLQGSGEARI